jgi:hypothetical protein
MKNTSFFTGWIAVVWMLMLSTVAPLKSQTFLTNGLVAFYPFNGNANDASGNGNDGVVNGATLTENRFGEPDKAYYFNGSDSFITAIVSNLPTGSASLTVSLWAKSQGSRANGEEVIWWGSPQVNSAFQIFNNGISWHAGGYGGGDDLSSQVLVDTNWHNLVVTYDGSTMIITIDGIFSQGQTLVMNTPVSTVKIGSSTSGGPAFFAGSIDDIRIYNRVLSPLEVAQLYSIESGPKIDLIKAVKPSFSGLSVGTNYQLQVSGNFTTWTNEGTPFPATNSIMVYPGYFDVPNWQALYFQLKVAP